MLYNDCRITRLEPARKHEINDAALLWQFVSITHESSDGLPAKSATTEITSRDIARGIEKGLT
jgi:hypothetical protein